jgi:hypothetical protein
MESLENKIINILKNDPLDRHSYFQLKYFVVGKEPTIQAKLWRCIRELKARKESIESISAEIDQTRDNKRLLQIGKQRQSEITANDELSKEERTINLRKIDRQIAACDKALFQLEHKLKDAEEEAAFFVKCFEELEKVEKLQSWDDEESQTEYWSQKFAQDLNLKMLLRQPLDTELVKTILSLDDRAEIKLQTQQMLEKVREIDGRVMQAQLESKDLLSAKGRK